MSGEDYVKKSLNKTLLNNAKQSALSFCRDLPLKNSKFSDAKEKHKLQKKACLDSVNKDFDKFKRAIKE